MSPAGQHIRLVPHVESPHYFDPIVCHAVENGPVLRIARRSRNEVVFSSAILHRQQAEISMGLGGTVRATF